MVFAATFSQLPGKESNLHSSGPKPDVLPFDYPGRSQLAHSLPGRGWLSLGADCRSGPSSSARRGLAIRAEPSLESISASQPGVRHGSAARSAGRAIRAGAGDGSGAALFPGIARFAVRFDARRTGVTMAVHRLSACPADVLPDRARTLARIGSGDANPHVAG